MTNHLTPGAKALYNNGIVTIIDTSGLGTYVHIRDEHGNIFSVHPDLLTPLLTAVVQEDGTVKEVNRFGEYPKDGEFADEGSCDAWKEIESQRRTFHALHTDNARFVTQMFPGATVLGYEKDSKFIIVKIQTA